MKKTLSILMIVAMLFSMVVAAIPAGAAAAEPVTVLDPDKVGNVVITDENREDHIEELLEEGYIPLANNVWADYEEIYGEGVVKNFNNIFDGGEDIADGGKFFLIEDVVASKTFRSKAVTKDNGQGEHWVDNFTLDGCGYSITVSKPLFEVSNNTDFKNVTFKGTIGENSRCGAFSALSMWEAHGYSNFENVTSELVHNNDNKATHQRLTALTIYAENSTFKNVKVTGNHTLNANGGTMDNIGAIAGEVSGNTVFENCYVSGVTSVESPILARINGIGGIVGRVQGEATFKNCVSERIININTTFQSEFTTHKESDGTLTASQDVGIGGIAGIVNKGTFENCVNKGTITVNGKFNIADKQLRVGGILGYTGAGVVMNNCANAADINLGFDNSFEISTDKEGQTLKATAHHRAGFGGIVGASYGGVNTLTNCVNDGNITLDKGNVNACGGVIGYVAGSDAKVVDSDNNGDIKFQNGAALGQPKDEGMSFGGVVGMSKASNLLVENCDNNADLVFATVQPPSANYTAGGKEQTHKFHTGVCAVGGVLGYQYVSGAKEVSVINCVNDGTLQAADYSTRIPFLGGIVGGARGVTNLLVDKCINNADINMTCAGEWSSMAGILGQYSSIGNWMHNNNREVAATADIRGCVNNGKINGNTDVAGILGANHEMEATKLVTTIFACTNNGAVTSTASSGVASGIYAIAVSKGYLNVEYCVNNGAITSKTQASGIVSKLDGFTDATIKNSKNTGAINAVNRAGGIASTATTASSLNIISCFNSGAVTVTAKADGVAAGILGYSTNKSVKIDKSVNSGKVSSADDNLEAPITVNQVTLASGVTNYYLSGCVAKPSSFKGTSKDQNGINTIVNGMVFAAAGDPFHLNKSIKKTDAFIKSDYVTATWTAVANALTGAKNVAGNIKSTQEAIDNAKKALDDAIAGLDPKDLDLTAFNKKYAEYKALDKSKYDGNSYLEVKRAVEAAEIIKDTENALQSVFDKAVALIGQRISELQDWKPPKGDIDVDAWGDMTVAPLHTTAPATQPTTPPTEATTPAPTTAATEPADEGCGGLIGGAAIVATAVLALGAGISLKKKED